MKKIFQNPTLVGTVSVVLIIFLSSFSFKRGGDSYTISVNGKEVIQYYVFSKEPLPSLSVNPDSQDKLSVYYNECGKIGTSRKLTIRDDQNKVLKEWKFANALDEHTPMMLNAKEIAANGNVGLFYSSKEVTTPRKLVNLVTGSTTSASRLK